jgi:hypothetical protein
MSKSRIAYSCVSLCLAVSLCVASGTIGVAGATKRPGSGSTKKKPKPTKKKPKPHGGSKGKKPTASVIDGSWQASGTVAVAKHIEDAKVGEKVSRNWAIRTTCSSAGACTTALSYRVSGGHMTRIPLKGSKKSWSGTIDHQMFPCTNGGTAVGSLTMKLKVTAFTTHLKRSVASRMTATGTQVGTGCTSVKEVVKLNVSRLAY